MKNMIRVFQDFVEQFVIGCAAKRLKKISIVAINSKFLPFFRNELILLQVSTLQ